MNTVEQVKKGKPTWKPANVLDVFNKDPDFTYRIIEKSPSNLAKKEMEGWEILSGVTSDKANLQDAYGRINDGKPLTSVFERHDCVLGRIPNEMKEARDEYQRDLRERSVKALKKQAQKEMGKDAEVHGNLSFERNGVRTVIE